VERRRDEGGTNVRHRSRVCERAGPSTTKPQLQTRSAQTRSAQTRSGKPNAEQLRKVPAGGAHTEEGHCPTRGRMPIEFQEEVKKKAIQTEFFPTNIKARPLQLDGEVVPELIHKVRRARGTAVAAAGGTHARGGGPQYTCPTWVRGEGNAHAPAGTWPHGD
jgi:hypothetical protein